jgi:hypothetical protein
MQENPLVQAQPRRHLPNPLHLLLPPLPHPPLPILDPLLLCLGRRLLGGSFRNRMIPSTGAMSQKLLLEYFVHEIELLLALDHHHPLLPQQIHRLRHGIAVGRQVVELAGVHEAQEVVEGDESP